MKIIKIVLIVLTAIQLMGLASSVFLAKSFALGLEEYNGLIYLTVFWSIYFICKYYKNKRTTDQADNLMKEKVKESEEKV
ncbi:MAG: hypothetical protein HY001_03440 [Candidatus Portnoybacteria bacterium]|nr:hypothetical protein [Candidatus Portnoybacteria bacterium]